MYISSPYLDMQVTPLVNASDPNNMSFTARIIREVEADVSETWSPVLLAFLERVSRLSHKIRDYSDRSGT